MRSVIDNYFVKNKKKLKNTIRFIFNDLWSFESKDLSFACDLNCKENMVWSYAYGKYLAGFLPIVYGVSFFNIGRLETLRKFFGHKEASIMIINAGAVGYDNYGWQHAFKDNDDIKIMKALGFEIYDFSTSEIQKMNDLGLLAYYQKNWSSIFKNFLSQKKSHVYIRLGRDIKIKSKGK